MCVRKKGLNNAKVCADMYTINVVEKEREKIYISFPLRHEGRGREREATSSLSEWDEMSK